MFLHSVGMQRALPGWLWKRLVTLFSGVLKKAVAMELYSPSAQNSLQREINGKSHTPGKERKNYPSCDRKTEQCLSTQAVMPVPSLPENLKAVNLIASTPAQKHVVLM